MKSTRLRLAVIAGALALTAAVHLAVPAGPHGWHWVHLLAQKLYLLPILLAAAWFGPRAAFGTTGAVTLLFGVHILRQWAGLPMVQADQAAELANFWLVAAVSSVLLERERRAFHGVRIAHEETLRALSASLELREPYTAGHSRRVRDYALLIADEMGITDEHSRATLAWGGVLHDIGKIGIPDRILRKEDALSIQEWDEMRKHPELGAALIGDIGFLQEARALVLSHHERYDGSGYPRGLAGEAIPIGARIFAVADALDAATTDRPYRRALSWAEAATRIEYGRGSQFDPAVVDAFLRIPFEQWSRVAASLGASVLRHAASEAEGETGDMTSAHELDMRIETGKE